MRLNGWLRLWIVATLVWLGIVAYFAWQMRPRPETTPHNPGFLSQVEPQSAILYCSSTISTVECEESATIVANMPNGYRLLLAIPASNPDSHAAAKSYWQAVKLASKKEANRLLLYAGAVWLGASITALLIGIGGAWVRRGFRDS